jgi:hypothetical protein
MATARSSPNLLRCDAVLVGRDLPDARAVDTNHVDDGADATGARGAPPSSCLPDRARRSTI